MEGVGFPPMRGSSLVAAGSLAAVSPQNKRSTPHLRRPVVSQAPSVDGWPKALRPLFLDEVPGRLEECRGKLASLDRDLGKLDKNGNSSLLEPECEVSPSARLRASLGPEPEPEASEQELTDSVLQIKSELLALHAKWKAVDEDRCRIESQRNATSAKLKASEEAAKALRAEVSSVTARAAEVDSDREAVRDSLGVSEADMEGLQELVRAAEETVRELNQQNRDLLARLYTSQSEVESLRHRAEVKEQARAVKHENRLEMRKEAERAEKRRLEQLLMEKVQLEFEEELRQEQQAADRRERELKRAVAEANLREEEGQELIKYWTGEGMPKPPKWHRSAAPTLLTKRKRRVHGMIPGVPAMPFGEQPRTLIERPTPEDEAEDDPAPLALEANLLEQMPDDAGVDALLQALMNSGMKMAVPELVYARGASACNSEKGSNFVPASCKVDAAAQQFNLQVLEATGPPRRIPLGEVISINRPDDNKGVVDVVLLSLGANQQAQRLRITTEDEHAASALVAALTMPDRILPGSSLASGRTGVSMGPSEAQAVK